MFCIRGSIDIKYTGVVVVIPTRNRAALASNSINSVLNHAEQNIHVLVSDNSTSMKDSKELSNICEKKGDTRLHYIRPPKPMAMSDHWEWAIQQALRIYEVNHFTYLSDRVVLMSDALNQIRPLAIRHPEKVISYCGNNVNDSKVPVHLFQWDYTERVYELKSKHLLYLASKCKWPAPIPKMFNCFVPRSVFDSIHNRFGRIFDSISPDYCFAFRCLDAVDSVIYYDKPINIDYGLNRSTGRGCAQGILNEGYSDFLSTMGGKLHFFAAPIPDLIISANAKVQEYCFLKDQTKSPKLPDLDKTCYLESMAHAVEFIKNPDLKLNMKKLLEVHGWKKPEIGFNQIDLGNSLLIISSLIHKFRQFLRSQTFKRLWRLSNRLLGIYPSGITLEFKTVEKAIAYANKYPRKRRSKPRHLMEDLEMPNLKPL